MSELLIFICAILTMTTTARAEVEPSLLEQKMEIAGMVDIQSLDKEIKVELKYATTDNFTEVILYDTLRYAYLHPLAADKLVRAKALLQEKYPDYTLLVYDAARPVSVQRKMYAVVQGTSKAAYVAEPNRRGLHNFGMAVDLTVCDASGEPLDMGTEFDHLGFAAGTNNEADLVARGILTKEQVENRLILRDAMRGAGFRVIRGEWWHFNAVTLREAWAKYKVIE